MKLYEIEETKEWAWVSLEHDEVRIYYNIYDDYISFCVVELNDDTHKLTNIHADVVVMFTGGSEVWRKYVSIIHSSNEPHKVIIGGNLKRMSRVLLRLDRLLDKYRDT